MYIYTYIIKCMFTTPWFLSGRSPWRSFQRVLLNPAAAQVRNIYLIMCIHTVIHIYIYIVEYIDKTVTSRWPIAMAQLQRLLVNPAAAQVKNIIVYIHTVIYICIYI